MKTWRVELTAGGKSLAETKIKRGIFQRDTLSLFIISMIPLNHKLRKCTGEYKLTRSQGKINHLMNMDEIKLFAKNEKELETLIHTVRIYSQDIEMEFGIEKCGMFVMKSGKRHRTEGIELPNRDKIWTLGENDAYKYLAILEADTIKQVEIKDKIRKEYLKRTRKLLETKLSSRNLIKGINTWAVPLDRYSGPFLKWTTELEKQWPCTRHYIPGMTLTDDMYQEKVGKKTCRHRRQRWRIDTTTRRLHRKTWTRTGYSHQKQCWQHDR